MTRVTRLERRGEGTGEHPARAGVGRCVLCPGRAARGVLVWVGEVRCSAHPACGCVALHGGESGHWSRERVL